MRKGPLLLLFFVGLTFGQYVPCRTGFNSFVVTVPNGTFGCSSYEDASVVEWDVRSDLLIDFVFALFATEACCDKLEVIKGDSSVVLGTFSGNSLPQSFSSAHLRFRFSSDETLTDSGFQVTYQSKADYSFVRSFCPGPSNLTLGSSGLFGCKSASPGSTSQWWYPPGPDGFFYLQPTFSGPRGTLQVDQLDVSNKTVQVLQSDWFSNFAFVITGNNLVFRFTSVSFLLENEFLVSFGPLIESVNVTSECEQDRQQVTLTPGIGSFGCLQYQGPFARIWSHANLHASYNISVLSINRTDNLVVLTFNSATRVFEILGKVRGPVVLRGNYYFQFIALSSNTIARGFEISYSDYSPSLSAGCINGSEIISLSTASGVFGCSSYGNLVVREWSVKLSETSVFKFDLFDTESGYDFVRVYRWSQPNRSYELLGKYSGSTIPPDVVGEKDLLVRFTSDQEIVKRGFSISYQPYVADSPLNPAPYSKCKLGTTSYNLTGISGDFGCNLYDNRSTVRWEKSDSALTSYSTLSFNLTECCDELRVIQRNATSGMLIQTFQGSNPFLRIKGIDLQFEFISNQTGTSLGFQSAYSEVSYSFSSPYSKCLSGNTDYLLLDMTTGSFGCDGYENLSFVEWEYQSNRTAVFTFVSFETEADYDFLFVFLIETTGKRTLLNTYSGADTPSGRIVGSNLAFFFRSGNSTTLGGFKINYSPYLAFIDNCSAQPVLARIRLPVGTGSFGCASYDNSATVQWTLNSGKNLTALSLSFLNTEDRTDLISVKSGADLNTLTTYSGNASSSLQGKIIATNFLILFRSNINTTLTGFQMKYEPAIFSVATLGSCLTSGYYTIDRNTSSFGCIGYNQFITREWFYIAPEDRAFTFRLLSNKTTQVSIFSLVYRSGVQEVGSLVKTLNQTQAIQLPSVFAFVFRFSPDGSDVSSGFELVETYLISSCSISAQYSLKRPSGIFGCETYRPLIRIGWSFNSVTLTDFSFNYSSSRQGDALTITYESGSTIVQGTLPISGVIQARRIDFVFNSNSKPNNDSGFSVQYAPAIQKLFTRFCAGTSRFQLGGSSGNFGCEGFANNTVAEFVPLSLFQRYIISYSFLDLGPCCNRLQERFPNGTTKSYNGTSLPPSSSILGLSIRLLTQSPSASFGFNASYQQYQPAPYEKCLEGISSLNLSIPSGAFGCNSYENNAEMTWYFAGKLRFNFSFFDSERTYDKLTVKGIDPKGNSVVYTGNLTSIPGFVGTNLTFIFKSDSLIVKSGFLVLFSPVPPSFTRTPSPSSSISGSVTTSSSSSSSITATQSYRATESSSPTITATLSESTSSSQFRPQSPRGSESRLSDSSSPLNQSQTSRSSATKSVFLSQTSNFPPTKSVKLDETLSISLSETLKLRETISTSPTEIAKDGDSKSVSPSLFVRETSSESKSVSVIDSPTPRDSDTPSITKGLINSNSVINNASTSLPLPSFSVDVSSVPELQTPSSTSLVQSQSAPFFSAGSQSSPLSLISETPTPSVSLIAVPRPTSAIDPCDEQISCQTGGLLISFGSEEAVLPVEASPSPSSSLGESKLVIDLVTDQGTAVGSVGLPASVTNSGGQLQANFVIVNSTSTLPNPGGVGDVILDLSLSDSDGIAITDLQEDIQICLQKPITASPSSFCLGFFSVNQSRWRCQDPCLKQQNGTLCGQTSHLTSFALLLQGQKGGAKKLACGSFSSESSDRVIQWLSFALICLALIIIAISVLAFEIRMQLKSSKRGSLLSALKTNGSKLNLST